MGLGTDQVGVAIAGNFIPELWSDEVIAAYKKNLVAANLVTKINHVGKKGDTIHIPSPTRGAATAKAVNTAVTLVPGSNTSIDVSINKHFEYSQLIEDIAAVQALNSMRQFYTDDAGYALGKQVDDDLLALGVTLTGAGGTSYAASTTTTNAYVGGDGTTQYNSTTSNASDLTDAAIRRSIQRLDDADFPMDERSLIITPAQKRVLLGISRFTEQAFLGDGNAIKTGKIGEIYGMPVYVTTNCDAGAGSSGADRICLLMHKSAFVFAEQMTVRTQTQYKLEYLGDLFTADTIYGVKTLRANGAIPLAVTA